jgi:uncharacterized caspase-like protein
MTVGARGGLLLALAATLAAEDAFAAGETVRLALVVGANQGKRDAPKLRFAERDAQRFAAVLGEVGQVPKQQIVVLRSPRPGDLRAALDRIEAAARERRAAGDKVVVLFYYSGHADGINLEIGEEAIPFAEIRGRLERSSADVRVAFVDSCKAGGLTESKGLAPGPSFDLVVTDRLDVAGAAFVTSASASEVAQESAELESSYFTHYLISALRGAGDADDDGRVTLAEAYQYAYVKTVADTARTIAGTQHPSYAYRITGRGDLPLSDLRGARAVLVFPAGISGGDYLIVDAKRGEVVAEVFKEATDKRRVAVPSGAYLVGRREKGRFLAGRFEARPGADVVVAEKELRPMPLALGQTKGADSVAQSLTAGYGVVGGALGSLTSSSELALVYERRIGERWLLAPRAAFGIADVSDRGLAYQYRAGVIELALLRTLPLRGFELRLGATAGGVYARQRLLSGELQSGLLTRLGGVLGLELPLAGRLRATLAWTMGGAMLSLNEEWTVRPFVRADLGVGYGF